jgi:hypothetical protein
MDNARQLRDRLFNDGEATIAEFIAQGVAESPWIEFKRSDRQFENPAGTKRVNNDRSHLAKAISGFANADGGVVVWGVTAAPSDAEGDHATGEDRITQPRALEAKLRDWSPGVTYPPHPEVEHFSIPADGGKPGFVVTYIPKSIGGPLRVVGSNYTPGKVVPDLYYLRTSASTIAAPHEVLAGLFGRRPSPSVELRVKPWDAAYLNPGMRLGFGLTLVNAGRALAPQSFVTAECTPPSTGSKWTIDGGNLDRRGYKDETSGRSYLTGISGPQCPALAPGERVAALSVYCTAIPPFSSDFVISITYGCDSAWPRCMRIIVSPKELAALHGYAADLARSNKDNRVGALIEKDIDSWIGRASQASIP